MIKIENLKALIPSDLHELLGSVYDATVLSKEPLKICFVGAFSSGKSSLINMLINQDLLPVALEETTALPTFVEYGFIQEMHIVTDDSSVRPISEAEFKNYTTNAPEGALYTTVSIPEEWLKDITIIDLPGLGTTSPSRREYTISQIRNADAIVYLLHPRGPSIEDLDTISLIRQYGKRLHVVVAHWDEVEKSIESGEKEPDLTSWESKIEQETQYKVKIHRASKYGHGRKEMLAFFERIKDDILKIREQRFRVEMIPILENAIGQNISEQEVLKKATQDEINLMHETLIKRKDELIRLKASLYDKQDEDVSNLNKTAEEKIKNIRSNLQVRIDNLCIEFEENIENKTFNDFIKEGNEQLRISLIETANTLSYLSKDYGDLQLPEAKIDELNIRLPQPEVVDVDDFIDISTYTLIEEMLNKEQEKVLLAEKKSNQLQNISEGEINEVTKQLQELMTNRNKIQSMPLPKIIIETENKSGKSMLKLLGETIDFALLFVNPTFVGTKIASLLGKGAKVASVAKKATEVIQTAQRVKRGVYDIFQDDIKTKENQQESQEKTKPNASDTQPKETQDKETIKTSTVVKVLDKIGWLEKLSFSYWAERLAGSNEVKEITDPNALKEQQEALRQIDHQIALAKQEMQTLLERQHKKELKEIELQHSLDRQAQLKQSMNDLISQAEQMKKKAEQEVLARHKELVLLQIQRAKQHWLRNFDQQVRPMIDLLITRCRSYWKGYVEQMITDRLEEIKQLTDKLNYTPEHKKKILEDLSNKTTTMQKALELLKAGL